MSNLAIYEQLDHGIEAMLANPDLIEPSGDPIIAELLAIARELPHLPSADFRERLRTDLEQQVPRPSSVANSAAHHMLDEAPEVDDSDILPTLLGGGYNDYPVQRANFAISFLLHAAAIALIGTSGLWLAQHHDEVRQQVISLINEPSEYVLPPAPDRSGGGGGGGDHDKLSASKGAPPRFAREQLAPPAVIVRNESPKLVVAPTVIGPPNIKFPQMAMGDPMASVTGPASNGTGTGGGIGSGTGGGVGSGGGPGVGPGYGGGIGGGAYRVGGGVSAPRALYDPDPDYSEEARKAKYQGTVVLWVVIGADGRPHEVRVARSLGMGLDEKAVETVKKWKFEPAMKDGQPVAVQVNIEVNFRLY